MFKSPLLVFGLVVCGCAVAVAEEVGAPDRGGYDLFHPVPREALRPLRMEAYDNVKDPTTVDAGHFQVEGALIDFFTRDRHSEENRVVFTPQPPPFGPVPTRTSIKSEFSQSDYLWKPRFKVGLLNRLDLEVTPTYSVVSAHSDTTIVTAGPFFTSKSSFSQSSSSSGFGAVVVESKLNLWGNDGGRTALSVSPVVSIPTDHGNVLGGVAGAFAVRLPMDFYVKVESDVLEQRIGASNYAEFFEGLSVNKSICSRLDGFAALTATVSSDSRVDWFGYAGFGVVYKVSRDLQLFGGMNFGLTDNAFDYNPRAGVGWRL